MMKEAYRQSDLAWQKALPIIEKEAKEGKPYIPWAGRPVDLPQSELLAFPGAEGGGAHSFGGRGGRVIVVTNLNDSGPVLCVMPASKVAQGLSYLTYQELSALKHL